VWTVILVAERNCRVCSPSGLHGAEMQMIEDFRNRLAERRQFGVDQQMLMALVLAVRPSGRNAHATPYGGRCRRSTHMLPNRNVCTALACCPKATFRLVFRSITFPTAPAQPETKSSPTS
jgi:hypothetical protein